MARIVFLLMFTLTASFGSFAQKTYFVYLQTETQEPFFVQFNNKSISSSAEGYLILPKLTDGTYNIKIGFPRNPNVQDYDLVVRGDDAGYIVKKIGDSWGISDLQSGTVQLSGIELGKREAVIAASRMEEEKRIADSIQISQAQLEQKRRADSLLAAEFQQREDSIKAATAAFEAPKDTSTAVAAAETNTEKPVETTPAPVVEKAVEAAVVTAAVVTPSVVAHSNSNIDSAATSGFKSEDLEPEPKAIEVAEVDKAAQKRTADSLQLVAEKRRADSIRNEEANREAQKKIEEAREIMRRTLGQTAATGAAVGAVTVTADQAAKKEEVPLAAETAVKKQEAPAVIEKADSTVANTVQESKPEKSVTPPVLVPVEATVPNPAATKSAAKSDPKFLDMDMGAEVSETASKSNTGAKPIESSEKTQKSSAKKSGLTSNNANTKIIEGGAEIGAVAGEAVAAESASKKVEEQKVQPSANPNCKEEASEKDFFTLRKKMAADEDPDEMLSTARKAFKDKCFSSFQVKNLCVLFLSDANKYSFLDMAYMHVSDPKNFNGLRELLSDDYYIRRFNAMIRE